MRYNAQHKELTRRKVLDAAARAIRRQGPECVSVASVMAKVGLTHGGFYAHFDSKEAMITASIEHMFEQIEERMNSLAEGKSAQLAVCCYINAYLSDRHLRERELGCPIAALGSDLPRLGESARKAFASGMSSVHKKISALLKSMGAEDADDAARSLQSELLGALLSARLVKACDRKKVLEVTRRSLKRRFVIGN